MQLNPLGRSQSPELAYQPGSEIGKWIESVYGNILPTRTSGLILLPFGQDGRAGGSDILKK